LYILTMADIEASHRKLATRAPDPLQRAKRIDFVSSDAFDRSKDPGRRSVDLDRVTLVELPDRHELIEPGFDSIHSRFRSREVEADSRDEHSYSNDRQPLASGRDVEPMNGLDHEHQPSRSDDE